MATIRDVSKLAGVSVATVSRVINKNGYVNRETEKAILEAMETLNYIPNTSARSLAGKRTGTVGLIVPDILNPFFPEVARAAMDCAQEFGYTVLLCNSDNDPEKEQHYFDVMMSKRVDGIIIASWSIRHEQILQLQKRSMPVVVIDNHFPNHPILSISSKNREGARMGVQHLIDQGCRKIGHVGGPLNIYSSLERSLGYEDVAGKMDWFLPSLIVQGDLQIDGGYDAMMELYRRHPDIDGVFAGNDLMAFGAMKALQTLGKSVPGDVRLIGFDGILLKVVMPELSTVAQPIFEIGEQAMKCLIKLIEDESAAKGPMLLDTKLIVRQTS